MGTKLEELMQGYQLFQDKYHEHDNSVMQHLAEVGQTPEVMVVACCDSRVDPALLLQCDPGDLFVVRNVANIIPPYENDEYHHGTSAALEYAVYYLKIKHLVILGHSQCGGIQASLNKQSLSQDDFISNWLSLTKPIAGTSAIDEHAKASINNSYANCLSYPWLRDKLANKELAIHRWFFDIEHAQLWAFNDADKEFEKLRVQT